MLQSHASQFKVETALPELANRQIQQIEIELKNLQIIPRLHVQLAKGSIRRVIKYLEPDGRLRMTADLLQFEVALGERAEQIVSFCDAQLQQDYFIFQKRPFFGNQPVLEQAFTLTVWYDDSRMSGTPLPVVREFTLNRIINRGQISRIAQFTLDIQHKGTRPASYSARWVMDYPLKLPLVSGFLVGTLGYHDGLECPDREFSQPVSFLIPELPEISPENLVLLGTVRQINWRAETALTVSCEVKIDFSWIGLQTQSLACQVGEDSGDPREVCLKTTSVLKDGTAEFFKSVHLVSSKGKPRELKVTVKDFRAKFSAGGILTTGILTVEAFCENPTGIEEYCQWDVPWDELIGGVAPETVEGRAEINSRVRAEPKTWRNSGGDLEVELIFIYHYQLIRSQWVKVLQGDEGHCPVWADVYTGRNTFEILGEIQFELPGQSPEIHRVEAGLSHLRLRAEPGWVKAQGRLDAVLYYSDKQRQQRMEHLNCQVLESFLWEGIEPGMEFNHTVQLKYDSYTLRGPNILYHYLFEVEVESYKAQEVRVLLGELPSGSGEVSSERSEKQSGGEPSLDFRLETEIPLVLGVPKAIATYRSLINRFDCRKAGNALLVEGNLSNELEYWDNEGFFRRELVDLPFWRFLPYPSERLPIRHLTPEIRKWTCQPVKAWPWRKGSVKIILEIELKNGGAKEVTDEGIVTEPG